MNKWDIDLEKYLKENSLGCEECPFLRECTKINDNSTCPRTIEDVINDFNFLYGGEVLGNLESDFFFYTEAEVLSFQQILIILRRI